MLINFDKALEILAKGKHTTIVTTDGKVALVPNDKADLHLSSAEAINLMFYVIRAANASETPEIIQARLTEQLQAAVAKASQPSEEEVRAKKYRELRGGD